MIGDPKRAPIRTVRLGPSEQALLLQAMDRHSARAEAARGERRRLRVSFHADSIIVLLMQGGREVKYAVVPRNLSSRGLAFIHGQFVHAASRCRVILPALRKHYLAVEGQVLRCRHVSGLIHEVSIVFDESIDVAEFVPLTPEERQRAQSELTPPPSPAPIAGTVLLVDRFQADRRLLGMWLRSQGLAVLEADGPEQARRLIASHTPDLLIMDQHIGETGGVQFARALRAGGFAGPIAVISADDSDQAEAAALGAGCNAFLGKPCAREAFTQVIEQLLTFDLGDDEAAPLRSSFADDPEMAPLLAAFVPELRELVRELQHCARAADMPGLRELCHRLKGAGASYGFASLTRSARLTLGQLLAPQPDLEAVNAAVTGLIATARRIML